MMPLARTTRVSDEISEIAVLAAAMATSKLPNTPEPSAAVATTVKLPLVVVTGTLTAPPVEILTPAGAPLSVQINALLVAVFCNTVAR